MPSLTTATTRPGSAHKCWGGPCALRARAAGASARTCTQARARRRPARTSPRRPPRSRTPATASGSLRAGAVWPRRAPREWERAGAECIKGVACIAGSGCGPKVLVEQHVEPQQLEAASCGVLGRRERELRVRGLDQRHGGQHCLGDQPPDLVPDARSVVPAALEPREHRRNGPLVPGRAVRRCLKLRGGGRDVSA
jgi:hypothetical protein